VKQIVLPNENPADFDEFRSALLNDLDPQGALEEVLADKIVADLWRLRRVPVLETAIHEQTQKRAAVSQLQNRASSFRKVVSEQLDILGSPEPSFGPYTREKTVIEDPAGYAKAQAEADAALNELRGNLTIEVLSVLEASGRQLDNLWRREEALAKSIHRGLHELERLKRLRTGEQVAAPAVVDVDVHRDRDGGEES
jgi:hypothetical protein